MFHTLNSTEAGIGVWVGAISWVCDNSSTVIGLLTRGVQQSCDLRSTNCIPHYRSISRSTHFCEFYEGYVSVGIVVIGSIEDIINGRVVILSLSDIRVDMGPQNVAKLNVQFQRWRVRYKLRVVDIKSLAVVYVKVCIDRKFYDMPCHVMLTSREVPVGSTFFGQYRLPPKP